MTSKIASLKKPELSRDAVLGFVEGSQNGRGAATRTRGISRSENAPAGQKSGLIPQGDVRLTANIREELHTKLKVRVAQERTTVGELIEAWIESWK